MVNRISIPRGTADILPSQISLWHKIEETSRQILKIYNYQEIRTPLFEDTNLFNRSLGATSEVVNKQLLSLASDQKEGFSLRPEGTASIVRSYIENDVDKKENLSKWYYIGPMFRGERPQKGRLRQFHQIGVEAMGPNTSSPYLDAETIGLAVTILKNLGLKNFQLKINTLGSPADKNNFSKWLRERLSGDMKGLSVELQTSFNQNIFRILDSKDEHCQKIVSKLKIDYSYLSAEGKNYYAQVKKALDGLDVRYEETPTLVRGLDYYTQTVFEITDSSLGSQDALGAGGRYNGLVAQLGGGEIGAVGFALGI